MLQAELDSHMSSRVQQMDQEHCLLDYVRDKADLCCEQAKVCDYNIWLHDYLLTHVMSCIVALCSHLFDQRVMKLLRSCIASQLLHKSALKLLCVLNITYGHDDTAMQVMVDFISAGYFDW